MLAERSLNCASMIRKSQSLRWCAPNTALAMQHHIGGIELS